MFKYKYINPRDTESTIALSHKYGLPTIDGKFIKWKGPGIPLKIFDYLKMIRDNYEKTHGSTKHLTHDDILTILELRYVAARSSLKNYQEQGSENPNYATDVPLLQGIMRECESLYKKTCQEKNKAVSRKPVQMPIPEHLSEFFA